MKKLIFPILFFLLSSLMSHAQSQDQEKLQDAFAKSYTYENGGNYSEAHGVLETVYKENSYELNLRLGWLSYYLEEYPRSLDYYQKAINLMPYAIEPKLGAALPLAAMGNWDEVISLYNDILEIDPNNTLTNYRMGSIYYDRKEYPKAAQYLEKVVNLFPFDYDSIILYAWTQYRLGKTREAKVLFNKALLIQPGSASAKEGLATIGE